MIKVSDFVVEQLVNYGIKHVFMLSGGGAMHLIDSVGKNRNISFICNLHEQACAIAAEGYARVSGKLAAVIVTSGPGGTNTLTGVIGQWLDSVPALYISGQVKFATTIESCPQLKLRQLGDQEINIVDIVRPITKFAAMATNPQDIKKLLDKAIYIATHGRPGPVWLDIPLDIQAAIVDENTLAGHKISTNEANNSELTREELTILVRQTLELLKKSMRPVVMIGQGVRIAGATETILDLVRTMRIPVLTSICGHDLIATDDPLFAGMPGICGDRIGNIVAQNCDLMLIIGARMGIRQISYDYRAFAEKASKIMVDIDKQELEKPTLSVDLKIHSNANRFIDEMTRQLKTTPIGDKSTWVHWCSTRRNLLPTVFDDNSSNPFFVDINKFIDTLFRRLDEKAVVVTGNGTAYTSTFQMMPLKQGVRVIANQGCASMGYDLPAAIGASYARDKSQVVLLTGDGSIQMNIQELATLVHNRIPIKIFVLDNDGYLSIRTTQDAFFKSHYVASGPTSGVWLPNLPKIAEAYGMPAFELENNDAIGTTIVRMLDIEGPALCVIKMDPKQTLYPKVASLTLADGTVVSKPLEDMFPFLKSEILENCYWSNK